MIAPTSRFSHLGFAPIDEPFFLNTEYQQDKCPSKVNLGIGVYRTEQGHPWPLPSVELAENKLIAKKIPSRHEYLQIQGDPAFLANARGLVFGSDEEDADFDRDTSRIVSVQTISGTGANHMGALFLKRFGDVRRVWIPSPTWGNHHAIWESVGVPAMEYPYFDHERNAFDYNGMVECLERDAQPGDVLLLHACAHNPTGADPNKAQWKTIARICERKGLYPFFDFAYQGFASGDLDEDAWAIRHFFERSSASEFCVAQSFSKNFGLYGQRAGALHMVVSRQSSHVKPAILSNLCHLIRGEFSMAPRAGSDLVKEVLSDPKLRELWQQDLKVMSSRIKSMRRALYEELCRLGTPGSWDHVTSQIGMFSYTGLSQAQVMSLKERHHIYMLSSGRISISGLNRNNIPYVAHAVDDVVRNP